MIETTSLCVLAWLKSDEYFSNISAGLQFISLLLGCTYFYKSLQGPSFCLRNVALADTEIPKRPY